jgi:hypothetical protein
VALRTDVNGREDIPRGTDNVWDKYVNFKAALGSGGILKRDGDDGLRGGGSGWV